jgi:hypothetical protein
VEGFSVPGAAWPSASGLTQVLVEFAQALADEESMQRMLDHLVRRMAEVLPITGAGVMLMGADDELHFVAASNEVVLRIEGLQNELHEGPCLEAFRSGAAVRLDDLSQDVRFPRFSERAWQDGLAAVFTFPCGCEGCRSVRWTCTGTAPAVCSRTSSQPPRCWPTSQRPTWPTPARAVSRPRRSRS